MAHSKKDKRTKVICEDDIYLLETEEDSTTDGSSAWMDIFCPQQSCEVTSPTRLA